MSDCWDAMAALQCHVHTERQEADGLSGHARHHDIAAAAGGGRQIEQCEVAARRLGPWHAAAAGCARAYAARPVAHGTPITHAPVAAPDSALRRGPVYARPLAFEFFMQ